MGQCTGRKLLPDAKATDNASAVTASTAIAIVVSNPNVAPAVSITSPANNAAFATGSTVTINANATDTDARSPKWSSSREQPKLGEDLTSPYSFAWASVPAGTYSLTAKATDNTSAITTSGAIAIVVSNPNVAPAVGITSPANNAGFATGSTVTINANATDSDGTIAKVEFFQGNNQIG